MAEEKIVNIIREYCNLLNSSGIAIERAFLYGSRAKNALDENSDIDIMIVSSEFDNNDDAGIKAWSLTRKVDTRIEPYAIGSQEFETHFSSPVIQTVLHEGIEIKL
jgi:predicted nucleotidyltransferase